MAVSADKCQRTTRATKLYYKSVTCLNRSAVHIFWAHGCIIILRQACSHGNANQLPEAPATIPTVGTNLVNVLLSRKTEVTVRELGGCMAPIWPSYYTDCPAIMFMVDINNRHQMSAACIELLTVLSDEKLDRLPLLLILNKTDLPGGMSREELEWTFRLDDIMVHSKHKIDVVETSAWNGQGLSKVTDWMQKNIKPAG